MKKTFLFAIMMMAVLSANAQLAVDTLGRVKTGSNFGSYDANLLVNGDREYGIYNVNNIIASTKFGLYNLTHSTRTDDVYGLFSNVNAKYIDSFRKAVGIKSFVYGLTSTEGVAIGVWGCLSNTNYPRRSVGVLGSVRGTFANSLVDTTYAGFFDGLTKIRGNLIVTGNIQGTMLGAPASPSGMYQGGQMGERSAVVMSNALKGLSANSYYHELTDEMIRAMNADNTQSRLLPNDEENLTDEEILAMEEATINSNNEEALPELSSIEKQILTKQHYGLDADQLEEVFPDLVYENEDGSKSINYVEMVPILVQAINELSAKVEVLEGNNTAKKATARSTTKAEGMEEDLVMLSLGQNKPNPFGTTTSIEVCIPNDVQKAFIYVYDLQGKKVDQVDITARGKQAIQLNAANLSDGMYLYSLIADGKVVETRRMIVEK